MKPFLVIISLKHKKNMSIELNIMQFVVMRVTVLHVKDGTVHYKHSILLLIVTK